MPFQGADTDALRRQAALFARGAATMSEQCSVLTAAVMSASWQGPDADLLRQRWAEVEQQLRARAAEVDDLGAELTTHAEEQDSASSASSARGGARKAGAPGPRIGLSLPELSDWVGRGLGHASDVVDVAKALAGGAVGPGLGTGSPWAAALDVGAGGSGNPLAGDAPDLIDRIIDQQNGDGPPVRQRYDNPSDEFDVAPGEGGTSTTHAIRTENGGTSVTTDEDGNTTSTIEIRSPLVDAQARGGPGSVAIEMDVSTTGERVENGDGTVTYTIDSELSAEARAELEAKYGIVTAGGSHSEGTFDSTEYSVTVPEGTPMSEVMAINPFDPGSIPEGAAVTFSESEGTTSGTSGSAGILGVDLATISSESVHGEGTSTSVGRNEDGTLSVTSGPTEKMVGTNSVQIGPDGLNIFAGKEETRDEATFHTATFTDDAAGREAYQSALRDGRFPDSAGDGVTETYTEHQRSRVVDSFSGAEVGPVAAESSSNLTTHQSIERTYPDGHVETAAQWLPKGDASEVNVVMTDSSDRDASYTVTMDSSSQNYPNAPTSIYEQHYGVPISGDRASVVLSEHEADTIRDNIAGNAAGIDSGASSGQTLATLLADNRSHNAVEAGVWDLQSGYHRNADGSVDATQPAPGQAFDPTTHTVRDGQIVPRR